MVKNHLFVSPILQSKLNLERFNILNINTELTFLSRKNDGDDRKLIRCGMYTSNLIKDDEISVTKKINRD